MGNYAHIRNADNVVLAIVDWDGQSEVPLPEPRPIDTTLILIEGATPWVGDVWNGTVFLHTDDSIDPVPPGEAADEPTGELDRPGGVEGDLVGE